jgi:ribosomal protein S18 acetylase RimI-like enzyme
MLIRNAVESDIDSVVNVHIEAFDGFFLTKLGPSFLKELYCGFALRDGGILRVLCNKDNAIIGFAGGAFQPDAFYRKLKKERALIFFIKILPGLVKNPVLVIKKIWYALFYKGEKPKSIMGASLLSSIAISPTLAGKSLGKQLLMDFEEHVLSHDGQALFLTTDKFGNDNVISFYKKNGYLVESEFIQADSRNMLRLTKKLVVVGNE